MKKLLPLLLTTGILLTGCGSAETDEHSPETATNETTETSVEETTTVSTEETETPDNTEYLDAASELVDNGYETFKEMLDYIQDGGVGSDGNYSFNYLTLLDILSPLEDETLEMLEMDYEGDFDTNLTVLKIGIADFGANLSVLSYDLANHSDITESMGNAITSLTELGEKVEELR